MGLDPGRPVERCRPTPWPEVSPVDIDAAQSHIFRWASVRCVRQRDLWGRERISIVRLGGLVPAAQGLSRPA